MKFKLITLAILIGGLFSMCSSMKVTYDMDKTVDFTKYKTYEYYGWADNSGKLLNDLDKRRIEKAFAVEFSKRGMTYVPSGGDLIVTLYIVTEEKQQTTATTTGMSGGPYGSGYGGYYGYGPGWGWGAGMATTTYQTYNYTVGTLIIDVYDAKAKQLVFESSASGEINDNTKGREKRIQEIAKRMMANYPVKPIDEDANLKKK